MSVRRHTSPEFILSGSAAAILALTSASFAVDNLWTGTTSNDWNIPTNWSLGRVPTNANGQPVGDPFDDAVINILTNFPVITADLSATPRYTILGHGPGTNGRVDHRAGAAGAERLVVGFETGTGVYNLANTALTGGALTGFGTGSGSINLSENLYVGGVDEFTPGSTGTFNMNTSGTLAVGNDLTIGNSGGTGIMNFDAGTISTGHWSFIGKGDGAGGGNGTLRMGGGLFSNNGARTFIGLGDSTGSMVMSGGVFNNIAGGNDTFFAVGVNNVANLVTPTLTMTGGTINSARVFSIGGVDAFGGNADASFVGSGKGAAIINGASAQINSLGEFWVGDVGGSNGELTLNAGTISVSNWIVLARSGATGKLTMTGGSLVKSGGGHFLLGDAAGSDATLIQSGGAISVNTGELWVGWRPGSTGRFDMSGGTFNLGNWAAIGREGGTGTMNFTGGTFTKTGGGVFIISDSLNTGNLTTGVLNQSGTSNLITNEIWVGQGNGGNGTYNLSAGTVDSSGWIAVGRDRATGVVNLSGTGTIVKSGGSGTSVIVASLGGNGTVNQTGGTFVTNPGSGSILLGENLVQTGVLISTGQSLWDLSGGTVSTDELVVGWIGGVNEFRVRDTGSVTAGHINVGQNGGTGDAKGVFNQTGGTVTSNTWVAVGIGSTQQAEYNLSGGTTNAAGFEVADTQGIVRVSGTGVLNVSGSIENPTRNGSGVFNISGGTVNAGSYLQGGRDGQVGAGVTNQSGGIVTVTGDLVVQRPAVGTGTYNLSGGTLAVNGAIQGSLGIFAFTGGKLTRSTPGVVTFNGNLTTGAPAATIGLADDKTFQINGMLENTLGLTLELTGLGIPDQPGPLLAPVTGSISLGAITIAPAAGSFDIGRTLDVGFDSTFEAVGQGFFTATRINEDALFNPLTQSVYWLDEDAGIVTLQYSIIPEPGVVALATLAGLMVASRRRRRT